MQTIYETLLYGKSIRIRLAEGEQGFHLVTEWFDVMSDGWVTCASNGALVGLAKEEFIIKKLIGGVKK